MSPAASRSGSLSARHGQTSHAEPQLRRRTPRSRRQHGSGRKSLQQRDSKRAVTSLSEHDRDLMTNNNIREVFLHYFLQLFNTVASFVIQPPAAPLVGARRVAGDLERSRALDA